MNHTSHKKAVYIIGGPNGSGKTTFVKHFLPKYIKVLNFVNADDISAGLSPLDSTAMNIKAGKLMLNLIEEYKNKRESFGFETTLAGKKWVFLIDELKSSGYLVYIFFIDLSSENLSVSRVRYRVESGGHGIPEDAVRRRYARSRSNFWNIYKERADYWHLFDNSENTPEIVASYNNKSVQIFDEKYYEFFLDSLKGG